MSFFGGSYNIVTDFLRNSKNIFFNFYLQQKCTYKVLNCAGLKVLCRLLLDFFILVIKA